MRVVFGWELDGATWPETASGAAAELGALVAGPAALVDLLETQLGLGGPAVPAAERVASYQARLARLDGPARFCHRSFATDPWATARSLLDWRDQLVAGGWDGRAPAGGSARLADLAALEAVDGPPLRPGRADRLAAVLAALAAAPALDLALVETVGSVALLPAGWRRLLALLAAGGVAVRPVAREAPAPADGDLARVQARLRGQPGQPLRGDGSLVLIGADDPRQAADAAAAWLAAGDNAGLVILRDGDGVVLDQACHERGLPRSGAETCSRWRAGLQVLPLAFEARWAPFNPQRLLELMTLPRGPIPAAIAAPFADALREEPGIGGPRWEQAWTTAAERRRQQLEQRGEPAGRLEGDLAIWRGWLEGGLFDPVAGMPLAEALAVCRRVERWALAGSRRSADPLLAAAAGQAANCAAALQLLGIERQPRAQLGRLLDEVIADGVAAGDAGAEAAAWTVVDRPGAVWAPTAELLWWGFTGRGAGPAATVWSSAELTALAAAGVVVDPPDQAMAREAEGWRRAVLMANRRLVLVQPRCEAGAATATHPLWHEILGLMGGAERLAPLMVEAATLSAAAALDLAGRALARSATPATAPPGRQPVWPVAPGLIGPRETESATSLATLFGCPFAWVLRYPARLRAGALISVPDDNRIIGGLAHAIIALLYAESAEWTAAAAHRRALELFDRELPRRAAILLLPGRLVNRAEARERVGVAVARLVTLVATEGLRFEAAEQRFDGSLAGRPFTGTVDLLLQDRDGARVILDLKWTQWPQYRRSEIAEGRALQLAAYAAIVPGCRPDAAGYYMLKQAQLLFAAPRPFAGHHVPAAAGLAEVWARSEATYDARLRALEAGRVDAVGLVDPEARDELPLMLAPPCLVCDFAALCGHKGGLP